MFNVERIHDFHFDLHKFIFRSSNCVEYEKKEEGMGIRNKQLICGKREPYVTRVENMQRIGIKGDSGKNIMLREKAEI